MTRQSKTWELTDEERDEGSVKSISFHLYESGEITIGEEWDHDDEICGSGHVIGIPPRIWAEALAWLALGCP